MFNVQGMVVRSNHVLPKSKRKRTKREHACIHCTDQYIPFDLITFILILIDNLLSHIAFHSSLITIYSSIREVIHISTLSTLHVNKHRCMFVGFVRYGNFHTNNTIQHIRIYIRTKYNHYSLLFNIDTFFIITTTTLEPN